MANSNEKRPAEHAPRCPGRAGRIWWHLKRPPWRTIVLLAAVLGAALVAYALWEPGRVVTDGRHDLGRNAVWIAHGWLADDGWFARHGKADHKSDFRDPARIRRLADRLRRHRIRDVFPHLCPADSSGFIPDVDPDQAQRLLAAMAGFRVMPWIGAALDEDLKRLDDRWRANFVASIRELLTAFPDFAGVHVNIEPCPSGNGVYLRLLDDVRAALPEGKVLSVAAYPPPTRWHPYPEVHWDEAYYREVARRADQLAVMMYDTGLKRPKLYRRLVSDWTREVLNWSAGANVLVGLPAYDDAGVGYHDPEVENLANGLSGMHAGLASHGRLPEVYQGVALYCQWEMDEAEWDCFRRHFCRPSADR
jgi:hypothetical protein